MGENIFGNMAAQTVQTAQVQAYTKRQSQEVQAAVFMAKSFPRCSRMSLPAIRYRV